MKIKRPALWALLFTICGIYFRLGVSKEICLVGFIFAIYTVSRFVIKRQISMALCYMIMLGIGFTLAGQSVKAGLPSLEGQIISDIQGVIKEEGKTASGNQKLFIRLDRGVRQEDERKIELYAVWTGKERFEIGDVVVLSGEILSLKEQTIPGGYDEKLYLKTKGIDYKIYPERIEKVGKTNGPAVWLQKQKEKVFEVFDTVLPKKESSIVKAMVTGEKDDIDDETSDLYRKAGINHILCVSGLHVSFFALFLHILVKRGLKQTPRVAALTTIAFCTSFLVFTGFSPSSVRAVIMITVVLLGRVLFRKSDWLNNLAIAALIILLFQPLYLWNVGFQLSFVTAFGIWVGLQVVTGKSGLWGRAEQACILSLVASLFSYPFVAYHFFHISLVGIVVNLFILPFCGPLLFFTFLTAVGGLIFPPLAAISAGGIYGILKFFEIVCHVSVAVPNGYFLVGAPAILSIALYYLALSVVSFYGKRFCNKKSLFFVMLALGFSVFGNRVIFHENTVAFLDVGQGDSTVISTYNGRAVVVDGGGWYGTNLGKNTGVKVVKPYLEYLGIKEIDGIFLTHFDADHMLGVIELCENVPVKALYISEYPYADSQNWQTLKEVLEKRDIMLYTVKERDAASWESGERIECLYPPEGVRFVGDDDNHGSLVLKYEYGGTKVLLMGDAATEDERIMLYKELDVSAEILKLGHHGSKYSSSEVFLSEVLPTVAIISCGEDNFYGHPHEETLKRLNAQGVSVYRTDRQGTILAKISPKDSYQMEAVAEREPIYERIKKTMEKR
ncbi:ComEC family competence protein [Anaerotignum neopropionicum]|uniref:ComEC family competence protein n=1 Tax=Anaerotignum neopropionicum TaxID=36847 RepID=A0A136WFA5_9FIRM|nr:DNA internalization-related competence protein ComEC/Rec2 [Anaerotignum neopropionicum]KXL53029.1 ComEC family competence protein [Anaerotignum neopropionicum]